MQESFSPVCATRGCNQLSSLSETATGRFWNFTTHYCSDCYEKLTYGVFLEVDTGCISVVRATSSSYGLAP